MEECILDDVSKNGLSAIIHKDDPFMVFLHVDTLEGVSFLADSIDTDDPSAIDFYLNSRLVASASKSKFLLYQIYDASEYYKLDQEV